MSPLSESSLFVLLRPLRLIGVIRRVCSRCLAPAASPDSIEDPSLGSLAVSFWRMLALSRGDPPVPGRSLPGLATFYYFFLSSFSRSVWAVWAGRGEEGRKKANETKAIWLILPVVICLSQRLSHACLSSHCPTVKPRMAH